jgi:hypothetical protein
MIKQVFGTKVYANTFISNIFWFDKVGWGWDVRMHRHVCWNSYVDIVITLTELTLVLGCAASLAQLVILEQNIEAARHCAR